MKLQILTAVAAASLALSTATSLAQTGVQGLAEREIRRQEQLKNYAEDAIAKGQQAMKNQDYETAFAFYKSAVDVLPSGGDASSTLRTTALTGFSQAAVKLAEQRVSEGRFQDASSTVAVVLEDRYNPTYAPALALQAKLKDPNTFNKTLTPNFIANIEEVKQLLSEAQGFYDSGRFDLAQKRYEQVLNIDRYNIAARRGMELVNNARSKYSNTAYDEARGDMLREVVKGWELPVRKFDVKGSNIIDQPQLDTRGTSAINRKLDDIIIPRVDFNDATIREALDFLKQRAVALDTSEQDPSRRGVNIVLKLSPEAPEAQQRISLSLNDVPLRTAIDYVAKAANLKLKIEPYAVVVVPQSEPTDILITKEYKVPPSFITALPASSDSSASAGGGGIQVAPGSMSSVAARSTARQFLEANGVTFPTGASANFLTASSKLIVKNTQANLDIIDSLVEVQLQTPPSQVEIESKFLEVTQNNLNELGFDWLLGQFKLPFGTGVYGGGGTQGFGQSINSSRYPFINQGTTTPVGASNATSGPITSGNRTGSSAISVNAVDALLFGSPLGPAAGAFTLAGVFTNPQFQVVIRALSQSKGVDLVSSPKVTTKSGQRATIQIVREFRYPTEYDLPQVSASTGSTFQPVIPTTPTALDTKPVGITLEVEPTVGPDGFTIDLTLSPRVVEFDGFINYGSPISASVAAVLTTTTTPIVSFLSPTYTFVATENIINQPVFSTREVTTDVTVYDGQTVVLGGLIREDVQKVEDKTPILGDIPLAGRLFRTTADQHIKRNLIMFVTANLLDPAGQPLIKVDEEDEITAQPSAQAMSSEAVSDDPTTIPTPE
jgi:general secretion pathway protein D